MYTQIFDPVARSIGISAAFAVLPLLCLFLLLGVLRMQARWAALVSLVVSMAVAMFVYGMPAAQTASGALEGAAIGFFPIIWIGINAIWLFKLTQESGHADVLRRTLAQVSADQRVQAVLIAFCFGALLEALAGGGAPVAICAVLLISIGVEPVKAAAVCLIADTSPVAFGALGLRSGELLVGASDIIQAMAWPEEGASVEDWVEVLAASSNDLEAPAMRIQPVIGEVLAALNATNGAWLARMSGSGATCFAIYENTAEAARAAQKVQLAHPQWWVHAGVLS